ncbi:MAG: signal peptidase II [bacterium]
MVSPAAGGQQGVAGSLLADLPDAWRLPVLVLMTIVALAVLLMLYQRARHPVEAVALLVIVGGALGSLSDRVRLGYVVDFIQWELWGYVVPTFNVADVLVCVGALGLVPTRLWRPARVASPGSPA